MRLCITTIQQKELKMCKKHQTPKQVRGERTDGEEIDLSLLPLPKDSKKGQDVSSVAKVGPKKTNKLA